MEDLWKLLPAIGVGGAIGVVGTVGCKKCLNRSHLKQSDVRRRLEDLKLSVPSQDWSSAEVAAWLAQNGVSAEAAAAMEAENIDGSILGLISEEMFDAIGITKLGDRLKLRHLIQTASSQSQSPAAGATTATTPDTPAAVPSARANPLLPLSGITQASAAEQLLETKYAKSVSEHVSFLVHIMQCLKSSDFLKANAAQKRAQLNNIMLVLSKLVDFAGDLPEKHSSELLTEIKKVYAEVQKHDDIDDDDDDEDDAAPAPLPATSPVEKRLQRIQKLKKQLEEADDFDLKDATQELRSVIDGEGCNDPRELAALTEVFALLQKRNESLRSRAESLRKGKTTAEDQFVKKLMLVAQLLQKDFSSQTLDRQEELLALALPLLSKYMDSPAHDLSISRPLAALIKAKQTEFKANQKQAEKDDEAPADDGVRGKLTDMIELLEAPNFSSLGIEQQYAVLEHAYTVLNKLTKKEQAENFELTLQLVELLKKKHKEASRDLESLPEDGPQDEKKEEIEAEDEDEDDADDDGTADSKKDDTTDNTPQNEVNLLPKMFNRLKSDTFVNETSQFEYSTLMWGLSRVTEVLSGVLPADKYKDLVQPLQVLLMMRMEQTTDLPASRICSAENPDFAFEQDGSSFELALQDDESDVQSSVLRRYVYEATESDEKKPLTAILLAVDSPRGTEALEIEHLSFMLERELGYSTMNLLQGDATAQSLAVGLDTEGVSLVVIRAPPQESDAGEIVLNDGSTVSLAWIKERVQPDCGIVVDIKTECSFTAFDDTIRLVAQEDLTPKLRTTCSWIFDGLFLPMFTEALTVEGSPTTMHGVVREMQLAIVGRSNYKAAELEAPELGIHTCVISHGVTKKDDDDEEEEES